MNLPVSPEPETPARSEQVDLTFFVEGEEEALPATLYVGDGYFLYIPDEDWTARSSPRRTASRQTPGSAPSTAMWRCLVSRYGDMTVTEARMPLLSPAAMSLRI